MRKGGYWCKNATTHSFEKSLEKKKRTKEDVVEGKKKGNCERGRAVLAI